MVVATNATHTLSGQLRNIAFQTDDIEKAKKWLQEYHYAPPYVFVHLNDFRGTLNILVQGSELEKSKISLESNQFAKP